LTRPSDLIFHAQKQEQNGRFALKNQLQCTFFGKRDSSTSGQTNAISATPPCGQVTFRKDCIPNVRPPPCHCRLNTDLMC